jgi:hypothetical protein
MMTSTVYALYMYMNRHFAMICVERAKTFFA